MLAGMRTGMKRHGRGRKDKAENEFVTPKPTTHAPKSQIGKYAFVASFLLFVVLFVLRSQEQQEPVVTVAEAESIPGPKVRETQPPIEAKEPKPEIIRQTTRPPPDAEDKSPTVILSPPEDGPFLSFEWNAGDTNNQVQTFNTVGRLALALKTAALYVQNAPLSCSIGLEHIGEDFCPWDVSALQAKLAILTERQVNAKYGSVAEHPILKPLAKGKKATKDDFEDGSCLLQGDDVWQVNFAKISKLLYPKGPCKLIHLQSSNGLVSQNQDVLFPPDTDSFALFDLMRPAKFFVDAAHALWDKFDGVKPYTSLHIRSFLDRYPDRSPTKLSNIGSDNKDTNRMFAKHMAHQNAIEKKDIPTIVAEFMESDILFPKLLLPVLKRSHLKNHTYKGQNCPQLDLDRVIQTIESNVAEYDQKQQGGLDGLLSVNKRGPLPDSSSPKPAFVFSSDRQYPGLDMQLMAAGGTLAALSEFEEIGQFKRRLEDLGAELEAKPYPPDINGGTWKVNQHVNHIRQLYEKVFDITVHMTADFFVGNPISTFSQTSCFLRGKEKVTWSTVCAAMTCDLCYYS